MIAHSCVLSTHLFLKMPFGISSVAEVQQKKTYQVFGDIEGVHIIADVMLIAAADEQEHDRIMRTVLGHASTE